MQNKWNCTIIALAMAMVLGVFDIHAVCLSCQEIVDDALDRACHEFAASPPNSETEMVNAAVEIFDDILLNTELCDAGQPYGSSAAACQENLLSLLGVSQAASVPEPVPGPEPEPEPEIVWYWADAETGKERGTFTTNGELVDGNAASGSYEITDFTVTATTTSLPTTGSYAGGQWNAEAPPVGFLWDGNGPTQFWWSGGDYTNGLSFSPSPLPLPGAGIANRISMSIDWFVIDEYSWSTGVQQSATIVLSLEPFDEPEPQAEVRVRKEIHALTVEERELFTDTYRQAWDAPNSELRQMADEFVTNFSRGLHNNGAFLPWHRGYLLQVENRLREISPNITIPYWDWSLSPRIAQDPIWGAGPGQFSGDGGTDRCVADDGPFGTGSGFELTNGHCLQRRLGGGSAATAVQVEANLFHRYPSATQYDQFRNRLEHGPGLHDSVHCLVGGTMCSARASNDPIFFLHHAMVDKIWADWQGLSEEHRSAYTGNTSRDGLMPTSPYTPADLLDMRHLPGGAAGGFVEVRYEE